MSFGTQNLHKKKLYYIVTPKYTFELDEGAIDTESSSQTFLFCFIYLVNTLLQKPKFKYVSTFICYGKGVQEEPIQVNEFLV